MYTGCHTAFDVMKEYLILGAELDGKYQIPIVPACSLETLPEDSVDFEESFSRKIKNHRKLNVNFYIDDTKYDTSAIMKGGSKSLIISTSNSDIHISFQ